MCVCVCVCVRVCEYEKISGKVNKHRQWIQK